MSKTLPLDKTAVTEFRIEIADIHLRQKFLKNSIAAKVPQDANLLTGDYNLIANQQLTLDNIGTVIAIHGYEPFLIDIVNGMSNATFECSGLFIAYGVFERIVVRKNTADTRITYMCA